MKNIILFFIFLSTLFLPIRPANASYYGPLSGYEGESNIGTTLITFNADDDKILVGVINSVATWTTVSNCATDATDKLLYNQTGNTFSCGTDQTGATASWVSSGGSYIANTSVIAAGDQIKYTSRETDGAGQIAHLFDTENAFSTAGANLFAGQISSGNLLTIDKDGKIGIGTTAIPKTGIGAAKLALHGTNPDIQYTIPADDYPVFQHYLSTNGHGGYMGLLFDAYYDGSYRSSDAGSNYYIERFGNYLRFSYATGVAAGSALTFTEAMTMVLSSGNIGIGLASLTTPSVRVEMDTSSNSAAIRLRGAASTTEIADMYLDAGGHLVISTVSGSGTDAYIDFIPESATAGVSIFDGSGAGTTAYATFAVADSASDDYLNIRASNAASATAGLFVTANNKVSIGTTANTYYDAFYVNGGIRMGVLNVTSTSTMNIDVNGSIGYDLAEAMWVDKNVQEGDLVSVDPINGKKLVKSQGPYDNHLMAVTSSHDTPRAIPVLQLGSPEEMEEIFPDREYMFVSMAGQVEVKVNLENGPIEVGDWITSSSIPGIGMNAKGKGPVVGKALESFKATADGQPGKIIIIVSLQNIDDKNQNKELDLLREEKATLEKGIAKETAMHQNAEEVLNKQFELNQKQDAIINKYRKKIENLKKRILRLERNKGNGSGR